MGEPAHDEQDCVGRLFLWRLEQREVAQLSLTSCQAGGVILVALIILTLLLAFQTVRCWIWRRIAKRAMKLNAELLETIDEQQKALEGARTIAKIATRQLRGEDDCTTDEIEWPDFLDR